MSFNLLKSMTCMAKSFVEIPKIWLIDCLWPYHIEITSSCLITEVKQHWAKLVLGWVTAWEYSVLWTFVFYTSGLL